ncbi:unnamed protein product [Clonostachys rhizophaga]|uniref:Uncharacterized protein n=1 Tax=Clonostachys rhizophaga TaxID=160324 RepID=A0A9N9VPW0_9HYPO|nr:unnamed protein product [Clonostachys rhizophaga]
MNSPTPYSSHLRSLIDDVVQRDQSNSLSDNVKGHIQVITEQYMRNVVPAEEIASGIRDLWYILVQAAKNITTHIHRQDTIIRYLIAVQALGPLQRPQPVIFSDGHTLWSGLPLLGSTLVNEFTDQYYQRSYAAEQRENMGGFIGRLLSARIYNGPALCALSLFRETFETSRPLIQSTDTEEALEEQLPLEDLTRALTELSQNSEYSLAILSSQQSLAVTATMIDYADHPHLSDLGDLARQAGITTTAPQTAYNPQRWGFWIQRLKTLSKCGIESIEGNARACLGPMMAAGNSTGLLVTEAMEKDDVFHKQCCERRGECTGTPGVVGLQRKLFFGA